MSSSAYREERGPWYSLRLDVPALGPVAFAAFRVGLALMLGALLLSAWEGDLPLDAQRAAPIAQLSWLRHVAAQPGAIEGLQWFLVGSIAVFAAGVWPRVVFGLVALGFNLWACLLSLRGSIHFLGPLPLALLFLLPVPWQLGAGLLRRRVAPPARSLIPPGYAPWILCLAFSVAFAAAGFAKGPQWAMNGSVRYHFMAEADIAWVSVGPWIAAHPALSIALSWAVVLLEHVTIVAPFASARVRAGLGACAAAALVGFVVMHDALWPAWWALLLGFAPWHLCDSVGARVPRSRRAPVPAFALVPLLVLPAQQLVASAGAIEVAPYLSAYDMYSATFDSPDAFVSVNGGPHFDVLATTRDDTVNVGACVLADDAAAHEMAAAVADSASAAPTLSQLQARAVTCAGRVDATRVQVFAEQRYYDWAHGSTGWKFRGRVVGDWPVGAAR